MKVIFVATGDIALPSFRRLLELGVVPTLVVTQPDKPVGRHQVMTPPNIKVEAELAGIPVLQPKKIGDAVEVLKSSEPDVVVVMAYGQILREEALAIGRLAVINLHASILPQYRGAACIQAAIDAGDEESGVTSMHMVRALDEGDMILCRKVRLTEDETGGSLHDRLADLAADVLVDTLEALGAGNAPRVPQDAAQSSYVSKLEREHGRLDWSMPARALERRIRAYDPWPGTYAVALEKLGEKRLKIFPPTKVVSCHLAPGEVGEVEGVWTVGCGEGGLQLALVQPEGGKKMSIDDYRRGRMPTRML